MKTITIARFKNLVARGIWGRSQEREMEGCNRLAERTDIISNEIERVEIPSIFGWTSKISTLDGITITYTEDFSYDEFDLDSFASGTECRAEDDIWVIDGVKVVDEDGEEIGAEELAQYLNSDFTDLDYSGLGELEPVEIYLDKDSDADKIELKFNNGPNVLFTGECLANASSHDNPQHLINYSGHPGCWTSLNLYRTCNGKLICHRIDYTSIVGRRNHFRGRTCDSYQEVIKFFGHHWLARELYSDAGINYKEIVA